MDFLVFKANHDQHYALNIADLDRIITVDSITAMPGTPPAVVGLICLSGELIPIVDVSLLFAGEAEMTDLVLICRGKEKYGIMIEAVSEIVRDNVPDDCQFLDVMDLEREAGSLQVRVSTVELF
jgi:chemotaxis signal transduction protein